MINSFSRDDEHVWFSLLAFDRSKQRWLQDWFGPLALLSVLQRIKSDSFYPKINLDITLPCHVWFSLTLTWISLPVIFFIGKSSGIQSFILIQFPSQSSPTPALAVNGWIITTHGLAIQHETLLPMSKNHHMKDSPWFASPIMISCYANPGGVNKTTDNLREVWSPSDPVCWSSFDSVLLRLSADPLQCFIDAMNK